MHDDTQTVDPQQTEELHLKPRPEEPPGGLLRHPASPTPELKTPVSTDTPTTSCFSCGGMDSTHNSRSSTITVSHETLCCLSSSDEDEKQLESNCRLHPGMNATGRRHNGLNFRHVVQFQPGQKTPPRPPSRSSDAENGLKYLFC